MSDIYLLTGAGGFLGRSIKSYLNAKDDEVVAICRNCTRHVDLTKPFHLDGIEKIEIVVHAAGNAHVVPKTEIERQKFFDVNVEGTKNLLQALEALPTLPKAFVFISSVAVYGVEEGTMIKETHILNAKDPYGLSKIQAEEIIMQWCEKNSIVCSILRLPLLAGVNPPGNLGAMIKGVKKRYYFNIAGGKARKSMVLATDVARIIPHVAKIGGIYNLTDGYHPNFYELSNSIAKQLKQREVINIPFWSAKLAAWLGDLINSFPINSKKLYKLTTNLTFDDSKARQVISWSPDKVLEKFKIE